jgi:hypothetical protein
MAACEALVEGEEDRVVPKVNPLPGRSEVKRLDAETARSEAGGV